METDAKKISIYLSTRRSAYKDTSRMRCCRHIYNLTPFSCLQPCPAQHPAGTKLMCYEDDNPDKPVRIEIVGSRWRRDQLMGKQAMYVVIQDGELQETEFSSAHETDPEIGWMLGWDAACPPGE